MSDREISAFHGLVDLAAEALGGCALLVSDEFFAPAERLLRRGRAIFDADRYTDDGKWMDGWESRRRRVPGHDWCIVRLGVPGRIRAVDIDTDHFLGNHAPFAGLDGCVADADADGATLRDNAEWVPVVPATALAAGSRNLCASLSDQVFTHVRLNLYPDGGVARLRVHGHPTVTLAGGDDGLVDLASALAGGRAVACSDAFFSPMDHLVAPGRSTYMGGGWETRRSRPPGADFIVVQLGAPGRIERLDIETHHFHGNYPQRCAVDGLYWPDAPMTALVGDPSYTPCVPFTPLGPDAVHTMAVTAPGPFTHLRLRIEPDGGVSRLRAFGTPDSTPPGALDPVVRAVNELPRADAAATLTRCCGAARWVRAMLEGRPYASREHLLGHAEHVWWHLGDGDWLDAFTHHPPIGADVDTLRARFTQTADLSEAEQAGVRTAHEDTLAALAQGNQTYADRFGHLFIVCATGLSAAQMLERLQQRLGNRPDDELRIAANEQARITRIRLLALQDTTP